MDSATKEEMLKSLLRFIYKYVQGDDDLYQEGCILVWEALDRYDPERGKLTTFAGSELRSVWRKRLTPGYRIPVRAKNITLQQVHYDIEHVADRYAHFELDLDYLDDFEKYLVFEHYIEGVTGKELARICEMSPSTISYKLSNALDTLRRTHAKRYDECNT